MASKAADDLVRIKTMAPNCASHKDILHSHTHSVKKVKKKKRKQHIYQFHLEVLLMQ